MKEKNPENEKETPKKSSGSMLPLIIALVVMPLTAFAMTKFLILPQLVQSIGQAAHGEEAGADGHGSTDDAGGGHGSDDGHGGDTSHGDSSGGHGSGHGGGHGGGAENIFMLEKLLVNVKNTNASRYLLASFAVTGNKPDLKEMMKLKEPMIRDAAMGILMNFEIQDLARIEMKERAKAMMITSFNNTLGGEYIDSIYFTEWAVQ